MRKFKWLLIASAATLALAMTSFAAEAKWNPFNKVQTYSIEEAQRIAEENSKQALVDELEIKAAQSAIDEAKYDGVYKFGVDAARLETNLEVALRNKARNLDDLKIDVYKASMDVILLEKELQKEKEKLKMQEEKHDMAKKRYDAGIITRSDVDSSEYSLDNYKNNIAKIENRLKMARLQFKRLLNLPLDDTAFRISDELKYEEWKKIDLDGFIEEALKNSITVYQNSKNVKMKEENLKKAIEASGRGTARYYDAKKDLEFAIAEYEDSVRKLELDIRNRYNDLLNLRDSVELAEKYAEISEKSLKTMEKKFDMGMVSKEQLLEARSRYIDAEYQKLAAIRNYNAARVELEHIGKHGE